MWGNYEFMSAHSLSREPIEKISAASQTDKLHPSPSVPRAHCEGCSHCIALSSARASTLHCATPTLQRRTENKTTNCCKHHRNLRENWRSAKPEESCWSDQLTSELNVMPSTRENISNCSRTGEGQWGGDWGMGTGGHRFILKHRKSKTTASQHLFEEMLSVTLVNPNTPCSKQLQKNESSFLYWNLL